VWNIGQIYIFYPDPIVFMLFEEFIRVLNKKCKPRAHAFPSFYVLDLGALIALLNCFICSNYCPLLVERDHVLPVEGSSVT